MSSTWGMLLVTRGWKDWQTNRKIKYRRNRNTKRQPHNTHMSTHKHTHSAATTTKTHPAPCHVNCKFKIALGIIIFSDCLAGSNKAGTFLCARWLYKQFKLRENCLWTRVSSRMFLPFKAATSRGGIHLGVLFYTCRSGSLIKGGGGTILGR